MGSGHVLIMFPSQSRDPGFARLQTGERGEEQNKTEHQNKNQHAYVKKPKTKPTQHIQAPLMLKHAASALQALAHQAV